MPVNSGNIPMAMKSKGEAMKTPKKSPKTAAAIMKADKKADAAMSPAMMKKDIASDRRLLASKLAVKKGKK